MVLQIINLSTVFIETPTQFTLVFTSFYLNIFLLTTGFWEMVVQLKTFYFA